MALAKQNKAQANPAENWFEETFFWKIKVWLQFTGWLLYLANIIAVLLMLAIAGIGALVGVAPLFLIWIPMGLAGLLAANLIFDIVTVRFGIRPKEPLPASRTNLDMFDLMRSRVSCRSFQSGDLIQEHLEELLELAQALSAPEKQLGTAPIRFEYIAAPLMVWPVVGGHEFLVAIAPARYDRLSVIDIGRSLQKIVIHATRMGLSTCWIGPGADQNSVVNHLGGRFDATKDHVMCVCALGYASKFKPLALRGMQKAQRNRLPLEKLFFSDARLCVPLDTGIEPFGSFGRCYEVCQWSPSSYNGQTTRCVGVVRGARVIQFDFCASTPSKYYAAVALGIWCANWEMGCEALGKFGHFDARQVEENGDKRTPTRPPCEISWVLD